MDIRASVPESALSLIAAVRLFEPLPPTSLEKLARAAVTETVSGGATVIVEGEPGEKFYIVVDGSLQVSSHGHPLRVLHRGEVFGEIALLRDVPRTATVSAATESTLLTIRRIDFLSAVIGSPESAYIVEQIISARISTSTQQNLAVY
jgi:CRP-like cAMP-binding protein